MQTYIIQTYIIYMHTYIILYTHTNCTHTKTNKPYNDITLYSHKLQLHINIYIIYTVTSFIHTYTL